MSTNNKIVHVLVFFCIIFFSIVAYLTYFQLFQSEKYSSNNENPRRKNAYEKNIIRGKIYLADGSIVADNKTIEDNTFRYYPFDNLYSHVIGFKLPQYGTTQLENSFNNELVDKSTYLTLKDLKNAFSEEKLVGNDIHLTINHNLQKLAYDLLGKKRGSIVALDPQTGEVLAMVSKPDFNPNEYEEEQKLKGNDSEAAYFVSRATSLKYEPGSTFKTLISAAAYEKGLEDFTVDDTGKTVIDGYTFSNSHGSVNGNIGLKKALQVSSNVFFTELGVKIGTDAINNLLRRAQLNKEIKFDTPLVKSTFNEKKLVSSTTLAATCIGQGDLQVTPLYMAMLTSAIANNGIMVNPYLVSKVTDKDGNEVQTHVDKTFDVMDKSTANKVTDLMVNVVNKGTGKKAQVNGISVAGKTGTAENSKTNKDSGEGNEHAWFVCFAPAKEPKIAIAILNEYAGESGGTVCAPMAQKMISEYLNKFINE